MLISGTTRDDPGSCRIIGCGPIDAEHDVWVADRVDIGRFPGYTRPETGLETAATGRLPRSPALADEPGVRGGHQSSEMVFAPGVQRGRGVRSSSTVRSSIG